MLRIASFSAALVAMLSMLAVLVARDRFADPDMWWQLKTGQVIWTTHHIPTTDLFSYTTNHHAWVAHEWLSQLLIYGAYAAHGYSGLMLWECVFTAAILIAGFFLCSIYAGNPKLGLLGALVIWFFGTIGFAVRPHLVGYLLLILELVILHFGRTRDLRWFYALPPLFALWVNCHGSFSLGIVLAGAYLLSSRLRIRAGSLVSAEWIPRSARALAISLVLSLGALLINPVGLNLVLYPIKAIVVPSIGVAAVSEWQPLVFQGPRSFAIIGLLAFVLILPGISKARLFVHELVLLGLATYLTLSHTRLMFVFGIIIAPIVVRMASDLWQDRVDEQQHPIANAVLITVALVIASIAFPSTASLNAQVQAFSPVQAVDFIHSHHISGPMLNDWSDGGYLLWALPEDPVFIDGRGDIYEWSGVLQEYMRWSQLEESPNILLDKYKIHFCLLPKHSPMATAMTLLPGWRRIYTDNLSTIFERVN